MGDFEPKWAILSQNCPFGTLREGVKTPKKGNSRPLGVVWTPHLAGRRPSQKPKLLHQRVGAGGWHHGQRVYPARWHPRCPYPRWCHKDAHPLGGPVCTTAGSLYTHGFSTGSLYGSSTGSLSAKSALFCIRHPSPGRGTGFCMVFSKFSKFTEKTGF